MAAKKTAATKTAPVQTEEIVKVEETVKVEKKPAAKKATKAKAEKVEKEVAEKRKSLPQPTGIRQTATANGARSILILKTSTLKFNGWRNGIQPEAISMHGR